MIVCIILLFSNSGCKKLIDIDPPTNTITTTEAFADSVNTSSAVAGIYSKMVNVGKTISFGNSAATIFGGLSSDELVNFQPAFYVNQIYHNSLTPDNPTTANFWSQLYSYLYQVNTCIENIQASKTLSQSARNRFLGECKFLRAFYYFYLVNFYGGVPLVTTSNYKTNELLFRATKAEVYQFIIQDLVSAQSLLPADYAASGGERVRPNRWAATALLARTYLYTADYADAELQSSALINQSAIYNLESNLTNVFLKNSSEAILQWELNTAVPPYNATYEGYLFIPSSFPSYYLSSQLLGSFENGDERRTAWVNSIKYRNKVYFYPYKYKLGPAQSIPNAAATEYYMILRLAEQYLIRAEAEANGAGNGLQGAMSDLNIIRHRAGLPMYSGPTDKSAVLIEIMQQRRIELFAEWGHRWLDLKRTGQIDSVMTTVTPQKNSGVIWHQNQALYPIPVGDLSKDPNLTQNPGY